MDPAAVAEVVARFDRDGYALVPGFLGTGECADLRRRTDAIAESAAASDPHGYSFVVQSPLRHDRVFAELFIREPVLSLVRAILHREVRFCGQNVIRNKPGQAVSFWHVDDHNRIDNPLPDEIPRWDPRIRLPVHWMTVQVALSDVLTMEDGPTEVVPGSHYAGRLPADMEHPEFEGRGPVPIFCHAGDAYLFNHQVWHRGAPNLSANTRYIMQLQYARGDSLATRLGGSMVNAPEVEALLRDADPALREILLTPPKYVK